MMLSATGLREAERQRHSTRGIEASQTAKVRGPRQGRSAGSADGCRTGAIPTAPSHLYAFIAVIDSRCATEASSRNSSLLTPRQPRPHVGSHPSDHSTLDADALPRVISGLRAAGYDFVTLDALGAA